MIDRLGHRTGVARPVLSIPFDDNDEISVIGPFLRCFANRPRHDGELAPRLTERRGFITLCSVEELQLRDHDIA